MRTTIAVGIVAFETVLVISAQQVVAAESAVQDTLAEVVVTAQRRQQSALDVPISVTVFDSAIIERKNIQSAKDYLLQTPNVSFQEGGRNGAREIVISMRGISDLKNGEKLATQSAFATYFDEFSVGTLATGQANPPLYDVQSVELLRGPQGTFFGRNSEGGAINMISKKPVRDFYGQFDAGAGRFGQYELSGVVNVPVSDTLFTRATVQSTKWDGPVKNYGPAGGDSGAEFYAGRGQVRWLATDETTVDLSLNYIIDRQDYTAKLATCISPTFGFNPFDPAVLGGLGCYDPDGEFAAGVASGRYSLPPGVTLDSIKANEHATFQSTPEFTNNNTSIAVAKVEHRFGDSTSFTSITGRSDSTSDQMLDLDHSGLDSIDRSGLFKANSWSQEFRLASAGKRTVDWTVGALYYEDTFKAVNKILIKDLIGPWMRGDRANENVIHDDHNGWAAFANLEWHLTEQWSLITGARYSDDKDHQYWTDVYAACPRRALGEPLAADCALRADQIALPIIQQDGGTLVISGGRTPQTAGTDGTNGNVDVSPRVAVNWKPNGDFSAYGSVSKGYKSAGVRLNPDSGFDHASLYKKERLWNYELGFNKVLANHRMEVRGAIYRMTWEDMQVDVTESFCRVDIPGQPAVLIPIDSFTGTNCLITPFNSTVNAEKARSQGVELSGNALVGERWEFAAALGYLDAKFIEFFTAVRNTPADLSGERLGFAPKYTGSLSGQYRFPLFGADGFVRADVAYRSEAQLDIVQRASNLWPRVVPGFAVANMQVGADWAHQRVALVVNNVFDNDYFTAADGFSYGGTMIDLHPRTWFLKWTWRTE